MKERRVWLILVRHTQTDNNGHHVYTGQTDPDINLHGLAQAENLVGVLKRDIGRPRVVISSDLQRTLSVARLISQAFNITLMKDSGLREVDIGRMAGMVKSDAITQYPEYCYRTRNRNFDFMDIGGESWRGFLLRFDSAIKRALLFSRTVESDADIPSVVIVSHGSALRRFFVDEHGLIDELHAQGEYQKVLWSQSR